MLERHVLSVSLCSSLMLEPHVLSVSLCSPRMLEPHALSVSLCSPRMLEPHVNIDVIHSIRAAPLLRVKAKITVKNPVCCHRRLSHTAFLAVILALTLKSGVALSRTDDEFEIVEILNGFAQGFAIFGFERD